MTGATVRGRAAHLSVLPDPGPAPAAVVIAALHRALYAALVPKRDGSRHHRSCLNRTVNASPTPCSEACRYAVGACLLAEDWSDR